jgi:hypothetical protein
MNRMTDILLAQARTPVVTWTRASTRPNRTRRRAGAAAGMSTPEQLRYHRPDPETRPENAILTPHVKLDKTGLHF